MRPPPLPVSGEAAAPVEGTEVSWELAAERLGAASEPCVVASEVACVVAAVLVSEDAALLCVAEEVVP